MKVYEAEKAIREALCEGGEKFAGLGLSTEDYVLFSDAKYMQCEPEKARYVTAVLAIKLPSREADEDIPSEVDATVETEDSLADDEERADLPEADESTEFENDEEDGYNEEISPDFFEDEDGDAHVYEIDFGFDVKNGEVADSDVESAILTFLEDCDGIKARLAEAEDVGVALAELRMEEETEYLALLRKLKTIRIGFLAAIGVLALVILLAIIL